ncbi:hypothetical protein [Methyloglobulus sp.]|uniref:hypothetical protein n=1 Tax=Methyloglobulus sp. TaxID=2518622 RepID=UPI00398908A0
MLLSYGNKIPLKVVLIILGGCSLTTVSADDDELIKSKMQLIGGLATVVIDSKTQAASGLMTMFARPVQHHVQFGAIGKATSIQPLLALRERYLVTQAELNGAKARLKQAGQSLKSQQELFRHGIAAKRSVQEREAQGSEDQAFVDIGNARLMAIANEARLLWGKALAEWVLSEKTNKLTVFLSGRQHLLQITLPTNKQLASEVDSIFIEPYGNRGKARPAVLISRSTQADHTMQGESYFFRSAVTALVWA